MRRIAGFLAILMALSVAIAAVPTAIHPTAHAQSGDISLALTSEYDIGFDCPITSALDPTGSTLWVLMDNCFNDDYSMRSFSVGSGQATNDEDALAEALKTIAENGINTGLMGMSFGEDGSLTVHYSDADYQPASLTIPADGGAPHANDVSFLSNYSDYPETSVFAPDGSQAAVVAESSVHVVDMQTGSEVLEVELPDSSYNAFPQISADGSRLYLTQLNNYDDPTATASTMYVYSLPDGELIGEYSLPSALAYVSPNGQYAALIMPTNDISDDELVVMDLESGAFSQSLDIFEPERIVTTCLNTGEDITELDWIVSGQLLPMDLEWLPDSSGFLTVNSYGGQGGGGDNGWSCVFDYSRLRHYTVSTQ